MMLSTSLHPNDLSRANSNPFVKKFLNKPLNQAALNLLGKTENENTETT